MRRLARVALLPLALLLGAADDPSPIVAQRGDVKITASELRTLVDSADPGVRARVLSSPGQLADFVRDRLLRDVVLSEAEAAKWDKRPDVAARADDARVQIIIQSYMAGMTQAGLPEPSEQEIAAAYEANKSRLQVPKQYNLAQIALLVPPNATKEQEEEIRKKALEIRAQLLKPKADFAAIARQASQDKPTAEKGGDLGWVRDDQLIPAIRAAVATMKDGSISEPIRSPDSFHILKLTTTRPPGVLPLEQAREGIVQALKQNMAQNAARAYVASLMRKEPMRVNEIEIDKLFPTLQQPAPK